MASPARHSVTTPPALSPESGTAAVLLNERARRARSGHLAAFTELLARRFHVELLHPRSREETIETAARCAADGRTLVVAAGGDGTVNAIATGIAGTPASLGLLPLGSGNDFARELGVYRPHRRSIAAERLTTGVPRSRDVLTVNGAVFCTVGGIGLVATSTGGVARLKATPGIRRVASALGGSVYKVATTAILLGGWRLSEEIELSFTDVDTGADCTWAGEAHTVFITNGRTLGGGLVLPVGAQADDGIFELVVVPRRSRLSLVSAFARLSAGAELGEDVLRVFRVRAATLQVARPQWFVADGEQLAFDRRFDLAIRPGALSVVA